MATETKRIGAAVLGLGGMGKTHVLAAKASPHVDRILGYEPDPERAASRGKELAIDTTSDRLRLNRLAIWPVVSRLRDARVLY